MFSQQAVVQANRLEKHLLATKLQQNTVIQQQVKLGRVVAKRQNGLMDKIAQSF
jgi:hypothetical protein